MLPQAPVRYAPSWWERGESGRKVSAAGSQLTTASKPLKSAPALVHWIVRSNSAPGAIVRVLGTSATATPSGRAVAGATSSQSPAREPRNRTDLSILDIPAPSSSRPRRGGETRRLPGSPPAAVASYLRYVSIRVKRPAGVARWA